MDLFDPVQYGACVAALLEPVKVPSLGPGRPEESQRALLDALTPELLVEPHQVVDREMALGCLAGLWLYHDFLDESHTISQSIETIDGSFWHGIMHRREPDPANAKYWFRRVGRHAVFEPLLEAAGELLARVDHDRQAEALARQDRWNPFDWIDVCDAARRGESKNAEYCRQLALAEWRLLFDYNWRRALG